MDNAAIRAVRDAIVYEVTLAAEAIQQDVAQGDLGDQALVNREGKAKDLHERVSQYEFILGEALDKLHEIVSASQQAAASAMAIQEHASNGAFEAVFG